MGVVVSVFYQRTHVPPVQQFVLPLRLNEAIAVIQPLSATPNIIHYRTGYTAFAPIVVRMDTPETGVAIVVVKSYLGPHSIDIAVLAYGRCVVGCFTIWEYTAIAEWVTTARIDIFRIHRQRQSFGQPHVHSYRRISQVERAGSHLQVCMHLLSFFEIRATSSQINIAGGTEFPG